ncbi:MAG: hypothetical protein OEL20_00650 [Sulfuritalea sp.]|nr:hypothetical protein [Sulfuritalea sp.]
MNLPHRTSEDEIVGSRYVGWELVVEFCNKLEPIEANLSEDKINAYNRHIDPIAKVAVENPKMALRESGLEPNHISAPYRQRLSYTYDAKTALAIFDCLAAYR